MIPAGYITYPGQPSDRAEKEDSFLSAFGNKPGANRRKQRRQRKGWAA